MNSILNKIIAAIDAVLLPVCSLIVAAFALLLAAQVFLRYALDAPLFWVEELCRFLLVYLTFLGSALAWGRRTHISIDFMLDVVGPSGRKALLRIVDVLMLVFSAWAAWVSTKYSLTSMSRISTALGMPLGYGYLGVPIGLGLIAVQTVIFLLQRFIGSDPAGRGISIVD